LAFLIENTCRALPRGVQTTITIRPRSNPTVIILGSHGAFSGKVESGLPQENAPLQ
jgi:hypothetical protein